MDRVSLSVLLSISCPFLWVDPFHSFQWFPLRNCINTDSTSTTRPGNSRENQGKNPTLSSLPGTNGGARSLFYDCILLTVSTSSSIANVAKFPHCTRPVLTKLGKEWRCWDVCAQGRSGAGNNFRLFAIDLYRVHLVTTLLWLLKPDQQTGIRCIVFEEYWWTGRTNQQWKLRLVVSWE